MVSTKTAASSWEIWIFAAPDFRLPVSECGFYRSERAAVHAADLLRRWVRDGQWSDNLADGCEDRDEVTALLTLRETLHDCGVDPGRCVVQAIAVGRDGDNQVELRLYDPNSRGL